MTTPLRLLVVDDNESDVVLLDRLFRKSAVDVRLAHLADARGIEHALLSRWDAVLLDYVLPDAHAPAVLARIRALDAELPVIVLSGRMAEQDLVDVVKAGAQDYVLKSNLARLIPAVQREVADAARRREQHALRAQLEQARKIESVGRLAGGIAHDFNNLLGIIAGYAELAVKKVQPDHPLQRNLERIQDAAQRAAGLSRQLLAFSRRQIVEPSVVDLGSVVDGAYSLLARVLGDSIRLQVRRDGDLGMVRLDALQIEQALINLAVNARDAMPDGGTFTLTLSNAVVEAGDSFQEDLRPGAYVAITLSHTGDGAPTEPDLSDVEPFFATSATAFGLAAVRSVVHQSGGHLFSRREPGRGTTFWLYFPSVDPTRDTADDTTPLLVTGGTETILLVEDQLALREVARDVLETGGYHVLSAPDPSVAIALSERHQGPIELLVSEIALPHMRGPELAQALAVHRPDMKFLFLTGSTDERPPLENIGAGTKYMPKPVTYQTLSRAIREMLLRPAAYA
jgi:two-component system cell cycle sensor histidine kinase/response regulator CckA